MKTIKIWADIDSTGVFDEDGNMILQDETTIKDDTWEKLQKWVDEYEFIVPLSLKERKRIKKEIIALDRTGMRLLNTIQREWNADINSNEIIRFRYYSEGLMKFLNREKESPKK